MAETKKDVKEETKKAKATPKKPTPIVLENCHPTIRYE